MLFFYMRNNVFEIGKIRFIAQNHKRRSTNDVVTPGKQHSQSICPRISKDRPEHKRLRKSQKKHINNITCNATS